MHKIILLMALMVPCLTACTIVRYYEVKPMRQSFDKSTADTKSILKQLRADAREKRVLIHSLRKRGAQMKSAPYSGLYALLNSLQEYAKESESKAQELDILRAKFRALTKGKKKITSKSPAYAQVDEIKSQVEALMPELQKSVKAYEKGAKEFASLMKKSRIGELNVVKIRSELKSFLKKLDESIRQVRSKVLHVQQAMKRASAFGEAKRFGNRQHLYDQIAEKLALIEQERLEVSTLIDRFEREVGTQKVLLVGPGLVTFDIMTTAEKRAKTIKALGNEITALAKKLKQ